MCGIAGHFGRPVGADVRARMMAALAQRGPDAQHVAAFDAAGARVADDALAPHGLVHARLSIIDPRPIADQPMGNDDGTLWICYNGEVYGWAEDARELEARGARFRTRSDTEFILRGYEAWGIEGLLPRLRGMFAFALVDFRSMRVHVVRDRMGLKPIVYAHRAGAFAFGSTVRSVLPWLPREDRAFSPEADRCVSRAPLRAGAAYDLHAHRAPAQRTSPRARPSRRRARNASLLVAATGRRPRLRGRCSTRRSSCASWPIARSVSSCRAASTPAPSRAGSPPPGTRGCARSRRPSPVRRSTSRTKRARRPRRSGCRTNASSCPRRSPPTSIASSPRSTSHSRIRRRFPRGTSRATRNGT